MGCLSSPENSKPTVHLLKGVPCAENSILWNYSCFQFENIKIKTSNCSDSTINFQVKLKNEFHLKVWNNSGYNAFSNFCMGLNTTTLHKLTKSSLNVFEPSRSLHTLFLLHSLCFGSGLFAAAVPHVLNSKVDWMGTQSSNSPNRPITLLFF